MPPVPPIRISGGVSPRTDRSAFVNPNIPIADSVAKVANTFSADVNVITDQILEDQKNADLVNAEQAHGNFQRDAQEAIADLDPTPSSYLEDVQKAYDGAKQSALGGAQLSTPEVLFALDRRVTAISETAATAAAGRRRSAIGRKAKELRENARIELRERIRNDPEFAGGYIREHQSTAVDATTPALERVGQAAREDEDDITAANEAVVDGFTDNKDFARARQFTDTLAPGEFKEAQKRKIKDVEQQDLIEQNLTIRDLQDQLETRADLADNNTPLLIKQAKDDKIITTQEANALTKRYRKALRAKIENDRLADQAANNVSKGLGATQEEADALFVREKARIDQLPEEERGEALAQFIRTTQRIPTPIKSTIDRNEAVGTAGSLAQNASYVKAFTENGVGFSEFGLKSRLTFEFARLNNLDFKDAAQRVVEAEIPLTDSNRSGKLDARKGVVKQQLIGTQTKPGTIDEDVAAIWGSEGSPPALTQRYIRAVEAGFLVTGDFETARQTAIASLGEEYGQTGVSSVKESEPVSMRYPPEVTALRQPRFANSDPETLAGQVQRFMQKELEELSTQLSIPGEGQLQLVPVSDDLTSRQVSNGVEPTWAIRAVRAGRFFTLPARVGLPSLSEQRDLVIQERTQFNRQRPGKRFGGVETRGFQSRRRGPLGGN